MLVPHDELQKQHFTALKKKYQISRSGSTTSDNFLYLILRKAKLGIEVTQQELQWLQENDFSKAVEIISLQQYQAGDKKRLEVEFLRLRTYYCVPADVELSIASPVYSILWKVETGCTPTSSEIGLLNSYGLTDTIILIQDTMNFVNLKIKYKATKHPSHFPGEHLYSILKKLDAREQLSDAETDWLLNLNLEETLEIYRQQEDARKNEIEFLKLRCKYRIDSHLETSIAGPLYSILRKLNSEIELDSSECEYLKQQSLSELSAIDQDRKDRNYFVELKHKYKASQYSNPDPSSPLFLILRRLEINSLKMEKVFLKHQERWRIQRSFNYLKAIFSG